MLRRLPLLVLASAALAAAPASAAEVTVPVKGVPAAGPAKYDRTFVTKIGPSGARTVLVLMPGYSGGAGDFIPVGRDLVKRVKGLQVWAVDRRSQALEDTTTFTRGLDGAATPQQVLDYYLGWITNPPGPSPHFTPPDPKSLGFAAEWGLPTAIGDLRRVILQAKRQGRRVILGGHSLGGSMTAIYATWDFGGRPGFKDVDGLVLIDGGALGTFDDTDSVSEVDRRIAAIRDQPFADVVGVGQPWAQGVFAALGGLYATKDPTGVSPFWNFELLPKTFRPDFPVTNRALLGYAFDQSTSPKELGLIHLRAGGLAAAGDPRDWQSGEVSPIDRVARFWAESPVNGVEWYFPQRLSIDVDAASSLRRTAAARKLGLRAWHLGRVDVPLYAFETDLTEGAVLRGARTYMERSRVPAKRSVLVGRGGTTSHLDPLTAAPATNDFLKTAVPFLERVKRRAGR